MELEQARRRMVAEQIRARGVSDPRVLDTMARVPRHEFVPLTDRPHAYEDRPLPLASGQTISQPYIVAYMTELLRLEPHHRVLEIGTGSAYQTAVLAELGREVWTIEVVAGLAESARETLTRLGYANVHARTGSGWDGWPEAAPFDRVLVTAAPPSVPEALTAQLDDGGVLVVPVGTWDQRVLRIVRHGSTFEREELLPVRFVPMVR